MIISSQQTIFQIDYHIYKDLFGNISFSMGEHQGPLCKSALTKLCNLCKLAVKTDSSETRTLSKTFRLTYHP